MNLFFRLYKVRGQLIMFYYFYLSVIIFCVTQPKVDSSKILGVFQLPSLSHHVIYRHLTEELARRGHEVTVITTDPAFPKGKSPPNLTEIDLHDVSYDTWHNTMVKTTTENQDFSKEIRSLGVALNKINEAQLRSVEVQKLLNETKQFDLILTGAVFSFGSLIFSHFYKVPIIQISSLGSFPDNNYAMGIPTHPLLYPAITRGKKYNYTIFEKNTEFYELYLFEQMLKVEIPKNENKMLRRVFGPDIPSISELYKNVEMLFLNTHPMWASNVPVPPNVIYIWGINKKPKKQLPKDLKLFLDSSKNGVIYMSFGTNTMPSALPPKTIQAFVNVFSELPYDILWKWDQDELPGQTDNIKIKKWFPQSDILRHPKVKLFITQCGLQSTDEAIQAGVPLVGIPFRGDQYFNAQRYQHFKIGVKINIDSMTQDNFKTAVETVIGDSSYRENIIKLRDVMRDEPQSALERAVWWTEYVLRHKGAKHLRAAGAHLSWTEYYEIPLVTIVFTSFLAASIWILLASAIIIKTILSFFAPQKNKIKKN